MGNKFLIAISLILAGVTGFYTGVTLETRVENPINKIKHVRVLDKKSAMIYDEHGGEKLFRKENNSTKYVPARDKDLASYVLER